MGQKTHPKGFRLITTQKHLSDWYNAKIKYPELINEDFLIRSEIQNAFKGFLSISRIKINRSNSQQDQEDATRITIHALYPRTEDMYNKMNAYFEEKNDPSIKNIKSILLGSRYSLKGFSTWLIKQKIRNFARHWQIKTKKNYFVGVKFIKNPFEDATFIAKYIAEQLEDRIPFRRVIKEAIKKARFTSMKGLKIQVSGRLNGIEIARSEWKREGRMPLHTLKAKIDYTHLYASTIYGLIGIKVWLFIG